MRDQAPEPQFLRPTGGGERGSPSTVGLGLKARVALAVAAVAIALVAGGLGYAQLEASGRFAIAEVAVDGFERTTPETVAAIRSEIAGQSILALDLDRTEARIRSAEPWIRSTTIRRIFPDRVAITLAEHRAIARVGDGVALLTSDGAALPSSPALETDLVLPRVDIAADASPETLARVVGLLDLVERAGQPLAGRVARIDVTNPTDLVLYLVDAEYAIHVGDDDFASRLNRFLRIEPLLQTRYADLQSVDLRFRDRVIVAPVPAAPAVRQG